MSSGGMGNEKGTRPRRSSGSASRRYPPPPPPLFDKPPLRVRPANLKRSSDDVLTRAAAPLYLRRAYSGTT